MNRLSAVRVSAGQRQNGQASPSHSANLVRGELPRQNGFHRAAAFGSSSGPQHHRVDMLFFPGMSPKSMSGAKPARAETSYIAALAGFAAAVKTFNPDCRLAGFPASASSLRPQESQDDVDNMASALSNPISVLQISLVHHF